MTDAPDGAGRDHGDHPQPPVSEWLRALERGDGREPLFLMVATDATGRLVSVTVCDPEDAR